MSIARRLRTIVPAFAVVATAWLADGAHPAVGSWNIEGFQVIRQETAVQSESQAVELTDELVFAGDHSFHSNGFAGRWKQKSNGISADIRNSFANSLVMSGATHVVAKKARFYKVAVIPGVAIDGKLDAKATFRSLGVKTRFEAFTVFAGEPAGG